jgi:FkbH-like protein
VRITDALKTLQRAPAGAPPFRVTLACGFTPLHLQTFLAAHLQAALPERRVTVATGLYGDLPGTLENLKETDALAVAIEWPDLDPRLGYRSAGHWGASALDGMVSHAAAMLERLAAALAKRPSGAPVAVSLPTLALPPVFHVPGWQMAEAELLLQTRLLEFASRVAQSGRIGLVSAARLAETSPHATRLDLKSDLLAGFPYAVAHADAVGSALARLLAPPPPRKGLITDLDDTLWHGLVGEIGPAGVSWDAAHQLHGIYQRFLAALAEVGVLIVIASKNDSGLVRQVLERNDLLLPPNRVFPIEAHWGAKSASVDRILRTWNIAADAVAFVDDSPMELAEVAAAHPGIETALFPKDDPAKAHALLLRLRDLFGKPRISGEDALRLDSIRGGAAFQQNAAGGDAPELFLREVEAEVTFDFAASAGDPRLLELVNKTNQFNLNGARLTEAEWRTALERPSAFAAAVSYRDKFGPLGKIAVIAGVREGDTLSVETWVMSCRAFSRRIEHQCLKMLFERSAARELTFAFAPTPRNGPLQEFFAAVAGGRPDGPFRLAREQFESACPPLYHRVMETQTRPQWMNLQHA